jgi:radical SAM/Cys-rich protein
MSLNILPSTKTTPARTADTIIGRHDFSERLSHELLPKLGRAETTTLQINVGKRCNQACLHCHVEAGPMRSEMMTQQVAERVLHLIDVSSSIRTVDITGGAPELNPNFRDLVQGARALGRSVIDRCNLTVFFEPGMEDLPVFLAENQVKITASLPCYSAKNVNAQRGGGVFDKSIKGLRKLNDLGYGASDSGLELDLVYNPGGPFLPPAQSGLEEKYRNELSTEFSIAFNRLLTLTNLPIKRFAHSLFQAEELESYMELLVNNFNPATVDGLMCRSLVSVGWDGALYDCDFNQMLELSMAAPSLPRQTVFDVSHFDGLSGQPIATGGHCFGCTAGSGSSCGGSLT